MAKDIKPFADQNQSLQEVRNSKGQFIKGETPPRRGRPKGSRNKLSEIFIATLHDDFIQHGPDTIKKLRIENPAAYVATIQKIIPKDINLNVSPMNDYTDENLAVMQEAITGLIGLIEAGVVDPEAVDIETMMKVIDHE